MAREGAGDGNGAAPRPHLAARVEDAIHAWRERRARRRGLVPVLVPYPSYGGPGWVRLLGRVVLRRPDHDPRERIRGWRSFTTIHVSDAEVEVVAPDGSRHRVRTDRGGVLDARVEIELPAGWQRIPVRPVPDGDPVEVPVFVVAAGVRFGLLSDIDDTVMVTALPRPLLAAWNTFVLDEHARSPVPGMAVLYERIVRAHPGAPVIYLSTGAWNVTPTLTRFLRRNLYPRGALLLTDWGPTRDRLFRSGPQHKRDELARLADDFPALRWVLVGDDGQHDEELYGEFARAHPDRVAVVAIRNLTPTEAVLAGGRSREGGKGAPIPWISAPDGAGLAGELARLGIVDEPGRGPA
ncbi:MAG: DUF2183 domain-containing protein [Actinomycetales bacterium]|nr:DUF2183 domain-containing protein [Actinomycetales bacterium]